MLSSIPFMFLLFGCTQALTTIASGERTTYSLLPVDALKHDRQQQWRAVLHAKSHKIDAVGSALLRVQLSKLKHAIDMFAKLLSKENSGMYRRLLPLHYRSTSCRPAQKNATAEPQTAADDESFDFMMHFNNAMKLIAELDDLLQPITIPLGNACGPCVSAWNVVGFTACVWNNRAAFDRLGWNMDTFELVFCGSNLIALLPGGNVPSLAVTELKRTVLATLPYVQDYWYGTSNATPMQIGFGSYWADREENDCPVEVSNYDEALSSNDVHSKPVVNTTSPGNGEPSRNHAGTMQTAGNGEANASTVNRTEAELFVVPVRPTSNHAASATPNRPQEEMLTISESIGALHHQEETQLVVTALRRPLKADTSTKTIEPSGTGNYVDTISTNRQPIESSVHQPPTSNRSALIAPNQHPEEEVNTTSAQSRPLEMDNGESLVITPAIRRPVHSSTNLNEIQSINGANHEKSRATQANRPPEKGSPSLMDVIYELQNMQHAKSSIVITQIWAKPRAIPLKNSRYSLPVSDKGTGSWGNRGAESATSMVVRPQSEMTEPSDNEAKLEALNFPEPVSLQAALDEVKKATRRTRTRSAALLVVQSRVRLIIRQSGAVVGQY